MKSSLILASMIGLCSLAAYAAETTDECATKTTEESVIVEHKAEATDPTTGETTTVTTTDEEKVTTEAPVAVKE